MPEIEFKQLLEAMTIIGNMVYKYPDGYIENGESYKDIILMYEPEEIKEAIQKIQNCLLIA